MKRFTIDLHGPLHGIDYGGQGGLVLLIHGLSGSAVNWCETADKLTAYGRVIAPELPGFGRTPPAGRKVSMSAQARIMADFIEYQNRGPALIIGNSMGALIGMILAGERPDLAERLVLAGGIDYRSAYRVIGRAIAEAVRSGEDGLSEPGLTEAARAVGVRLTPTHKAQLTSLTGLDIGAVVASRDMIGGSAPDRVREHCSSVLLRLDDSVEWATTARNLQETALKSLLEHARQISGG